MATRLALVLLLAVLPGCNDGFLPTADLKGSWTTGMLPSGAHAAIYLDAVGHTITGTASGQHGISNGVPVPYSVVGRDVSGKFTLTLTPDSGSVATFVGALTGPNEFTGTWSEADSSWTWTFYRFEFRH